jgi:uncharacterized protein (UPF0335 family)
MACNYTCDFCGMPLKTDETDLIIIVEKRDAVSDYNKTAEDFLKETHEVCRACKNLVRLIFKMKKDKLEEIAIMLEKMYKVNSNNPEISEEIKTIYEELKKRGYSNEKIKKILKKIIKILKTGKEKVIINLNKED